MKNAAQLFVALSFGLASFLANAEIVKVPVDPSVTTASGVPGYDPTVMSSSSGPGLYVQSSDAAAASSGGTFSTQGTVGTMSTSIGQLLRWPALPKYTYFQTMSNNRAYYRDAFTAITYTADASPGTVSKTWDVKGTIVPTTGSTTEFDWPTMTFYPQVAGYPYCFYTPGWAYYICGSTSIYITAYTNSQCQPYGNWTFAVSEDGGLVGQRSFTMLGEVPPEDLTIQSQNSQHTYDTICYVTGSSPRVDAVCGTPNTTRYTIHQKGCALTSTAMALNYHGVGATPDPLDDYLVSLGNGGYTKTGKVVWSGPAQYSGGVVRSLGFGPSDDTGLKDRVCRYGPQVMAVKNTGHFVMVTGRTEDDSTWRIYDPAGGVITTLAAYNNTYNGSRLYAGQQVTYIDPLNRLIFRMYSPAEIVVTAPDGKKTGFDPIKNLRYGDIPNSGYQVEALDDDETGQPDNHPEKVVDIGGGMDGEYIVQVTGTGTGTYDLDVMRVNANGNFQDRTEITSVPIEPGVTHQYSVNYSAGSSTPPTFVGGYDGGGQRPADVNRFLRYSSPSEARTSLSAGTTSARVAITYGATIDPATFTATLNGTDVRHLFSPQAGGSQTIDVPLAAGSNTLLLSVQGLTDSGRVATDTDRLVFLVQ